MTESYTEKTLQQIVMNDVTEVWKKDVSYAQSWKKRGGVGAFMMLARKWDRLETMVERCDTKWDVFRSIISSGGSIEDGMPLAEIRDLRRYLLLVEAEMVARGTVKLPVFRAVHEPRGFDPELDRVDMRDQKHF